MGLCVVDDDGTSLFGDQAHQSLRDPHADAADALGPQADRGREHQVCAIGFEQVGGADVCRKLAVDEMDDVRQRFRRTPGSEPEHIFARPREIGQRARTGLVTVHGASGCVIRR
jgi:hypothetical protein